MAPKVKAVARVRCTFPGCLGSGFNLVDAAWVPVQGKQGSQLAVVFRDFNELCFHWVKDSAHHPPHKVLEWISTLKLKEEVLGNDWLEIKSTRQLALRVREKLEAAPEWPPHQDGKESTLSPYEKYERCKRAQFLAQFLIPEDERNNGYHKFPAEHFRLSSASEGDNEVTMLFKVCKLTHFECKRLSFLPALDYKHVNNHQSSSIPGCLFKTRGGGEMICFNMVPFGQGEIFKATLVHLDKLSALPDQAFLLAHVGNTSRVGWKVDLRSTSASKAAAAAAQQSGAHTLSYATNSLDSDDCNGSDHESNDEPAKPHKGTAAAARAVAQPAAGVKGKSAAKKGPGRAATRAAAAAAAAEEEAGEADKAAASGGWGDEAEDPLLVDLQPAHDMPPVQDPEPLDLNQLCSSAAGRLYGLMNAAAAVLEAQQAQQLEDKFSKLVLKVGGAPISRRRLDDKILSSEITVAGNDLLTMLAECVGAVLDRLHRQADHMQLLMDLEKAKRQAADACRASQMANQVKANSMMAVRGPLTGDVPTPVKAVEKLKAVSNDAIHAANSAPHAVRAAQAAVEAAEYAACRDLTELATAVVQSVASITAALNNCMDLALPEVPTVAAGPCKWPSQQQLQGSTKVQTELQSAVTPAAMQSQILSAAAALLAKAAAFINMAGCDELAPIALLQQQVTEAFAEQRPADAAAALRLLKERVDAALHKTLQSGGAAQQSQPLLPVGPEAAAAGSTSHVHAGFPCVQQQQQQQQQLPHNQELQQQHLYNQDLKQQQQQPLPLPQNLDLQQHRQPLPLPQNQDMQQRQQWQQQQEKGHSQQQLQLQHQEGQQQQQPPLSSAHLAGLTGHSFEPLPGQSQQQQQQQPMAVQQLSQQGSPSPSRGAPSGAGHLMPSGEGGVKTGGTYASGGSMGLACSNGALIHTGADSNMGLPFCSSMTGGSQGDSASGVNAMSAGTPAAVGVIAAGEAALQPSEITPDSAVDSEGVAHTAPQAQQQLGLRELHDDVLQLVQQQQQQQQQQEADMQAHQRPHTAGSSMDPIGVAQETSGTDWEPGLGLAASPAAADSAAATAAAMLASIHQPPVQLQAAQNSGTQPQKPSGRPGLRSSSKEHFQAATNQTPAQSPSAVVGVPTTNKVDPGKANLVSEGTAARLDRMQAYVAAKRAAEGGNGGTVKKQRKGCLPPLQPLPRDADDADDSAQQQEAATTQLGGARASGSQGRPSPEASKQGTASYSGAVTASTTRQQLLPKLPETPWLSLPSDWSVNEEMQLLYADLCRIQLVRSSDVVVTSSCGTLQLTRANMQRLGNPSFPGWQSEEDTMLNDELVNFYVALLQARAGDVFTKTAFKVYYFNSFFLTKMLEGDAADKHYSYEKVRKWTNPDKEMAKQATWASGRNAALQSDRLVMPAHFKAAQHWALVVVDIPDQRIWYLDSCAPERPSTAHKRVIAAVKRWLSDESQDKAGARWDTDSWQEIYPTDTPQQRNATDCGIFAALTANRVGLREGRLDFDQAAMPMLRQRLCWDLRHKLLAATSRAA